jgi:C1A family cysteine protease
MLFGISRRKREVRKMSEILEKNSLGMGWLRDLPDFRDYTVDHEVIKPMLDEIGIKPDQPVNGSADLRKWCSPVEDQKQLGSCTANAGVGMVEFYERKAFNNYIDASRLFLYKTTRNLMKTTGDSGAYLRTTMKALTLFGVPPEEYWPYTDKKPDFDVEPSAFCYSFGENYKSIKYLRLDPPGTAATDLLKRIKSNLDAGIPSMFGFTVYNSIWQAVGGKIPYPCSGEKVAGGHAIMAVGYDDNVNITNPGCKSTTQGALLIRNSWGASWGDKGYGWLPYEYVLKGLATDFWTLLSEEWVDTNVFG